MPKGKKKTGCKQIYDTVNYCTFCEKPIESKISRHILSVHKLESRVSSVLLMPKRSEARKVYLEVFLANEGNFRHNIDVLKNKTGFLAVGRRETKSDYKPRLYLPCSFCKKFILKETLWLHNKNCTVNKFFTQERQNVRGRKWQQCCSTWSSFASQRID